MDHRHIPEQKSIIWAACFFALLTGLIDAAIAGVKTLVLHRFAWVSPDVAWMAPVAYLLFFLPVALLIVAIAAIVRKPQPLPTSIGVFVTLSVFSLTLPYEQIARWASALLAVGIGVQAARFAGGAPGQWTIRLRRASLILGGVVITVGGGIRIWRAVGERRLLASMPAYEAAAPNILMIILDTVRGEEMSLYGYARPTTPALDARARESVVFDRAISASSWTLPSHASLFTGRTGGSLGVSWMRQLDSDTPVLAEVLRTRGYLTGGFVANHLYTSYESGLARGFAHYDDYRFSWKLLLLHASPARTAMLSLILDDRSPRTVMRALRGFRLTASRVPADVSRSGETITNAFLDWQGTAGARPFFAFLNYFDAHGPYKSPEPYTSRFGGPTFSKQDRYDGAISWLDHEVGRILDSLERRGVLEKTIVVVTADHGDHFGDHKLNGHANSLYLSLVRVPLMIRYPAGMPAGTRVSTPVSHRDVAATLLDLAGAGGNGGLGGVSLTSLWKPVDGARAPSTVISELDKGVNVDTLFPNSRGPMKAIIDDRWHYIRNGWGRDELYDHRADSLEKTNLTAVHAMQPEIVRLQHKLDSVRALPR